MNAFLAVCGVVVLVFAVVESAWLVANRRRVSICGVDTAIGYVAYIAALIVCGVYALLPAITWLSGGGR